MRPPTSQFGNDITNRAPNDNNGNNNDNNNRSNSSSDRDNERDNNDENGNRIISNIVQMGGIRMLPVNTGRGIIRVVDRCEDAKENNKLDLSECQLMQVPDAVYHLMRHTELKTCDLSCNVIKKIPPKFAVKFNLITDLNLSHNQMCFLPDALADLAALQRLDISHNSFIALPGVVFKIPKLKQLLASHNAIIDIEVDPTEIKSSETLELVDLRKNPLIPQCHDKLRAAKLTFHIELSERRRESWEDLTI